MIDQSLCTEFDAFWIVNSHDRHNIVAAVFVSRIFDVLLTFQVKCTSYGSNEVPRSRQYWFCAGPLENMPL